MPARDFLRMMVTQLLIGTKFEGHFGINEPLSLSSVNIYFLSSDPMHLVDRFSNNCASIGWLNVIVCDSNFIKNRLAQVDLYESFYSIVLVNTDSGKRFEFDKETILAARKKIKSSFLIWFLGHEIGHTVRHIEFIKSHDSAMHFHDIGYDTREVEADLFVAELLSRSQAWAADFCISMGEFLEREYRSYLDPSILSDMKRAAVTEAAVQYPIELSFSNYEMPLLVRITRILETLTELNPNLNGSGQFVRVISRITLVNTSIKPGLLVMCMLGLAIVTLGLQFLSHRKENDE